MQMTERSFTTASSNAVRAVRLHFVKKSYRDNKRGHWEAHGVQITRMAAVIERDKVREMYVTFKGRGRERLRERERERERGN